MNKISANTVVTVEAGSTLRIPRPGDFFYLIESTGPLWVASDIGDALPVTVGTGVNFLHRPFKWSQLQNRTAAPIRVSFYSGYARYFDQRLNVYNGQFLGQILTPPGAVVAQLNPPYICTSGIVAMADSDSYLSGVGTSHLYNVRCIPLSSGSTIQVKRNGVIVAVLSGAAIYREFSMVGELEFKNISGAPKNFVFYSTQAFGKPCATPPPIAPADFLLLPPLTEDTGDLYADEAEAQAAIDDLSSNCIGFDGTPFIIGDVSHTFTTTNPANQLAQIGTFAGQVSAGSRARAFWSSLNLSAGDMNVHYILNASQALVLCSTQLEVDLYDADGNFINYYVTDMFPGDSTGDLIVPIPASGKYIITMFPIGYGDPMAASPILNTAFNLLASQVGLTANPIKALYVGGEIVC